MKFITFFGIFAVGLTAILAVPVKLTECEDCNTVELIKNVALVRSEIAPRDWLTDIIQAILGIGVPDLLIQINVCLRGLERLVTLAVTQLQLLMSNVDANVKQQINRVIDDALTESLEIVHPILVDLGLVLPAISNDDVANGIHHVPNVPNDWVTDIIESLLGISLEELLTKVATALIRMDQLFAQTVNSLRLIAQAATMDPEVSAELDEISESCVVQSQVLIRPILNKLYQVLPIRFIHKGPQLGQHQ